MSNSRVKNESVSLPPKTPIITEGSIGIHHVALNIVDLDRSIDFYCKVLGLHLIERNEHYVKIRFGTSELALFQIPSDILTDKQNTNISAYSPLNHIAFEVPYEMFQDYYNRLQVNDVKITFGPIQRRKGVALYFLDPDGNKIELFGYYH